MRYCVQHTRAARFSAASARHDLLDRIRDHRFGTGRAIAVAVSWVDSGNRVPALRRRGGAAARLPSPAPRRPHPARLCRRRWRRPPTSSTTRSHTSSRRGPRQAHIANNGRWRCGRDSTASTHPCLTLLAASRLARPTHATRFFVALYSGGARPPKPPLTLRRVCLAEKRGKDFLPRFSAKASPGDPRTPCAHALPAAPLPWPCRGAFPLPRAPA